jgi:Na+-translocating ferredoxin:NAD+ oxidoreductase subunit B
MKRKAVAVVDEARCIGCTLCIAACPVDAIVGAQGLMHTVIEPWCIGCELCVAPCPVDCIGMAPAGPWPHQEKRSIKARAKARQARVSRNAFQAKPADRRAVIAAVLARKAAT